MPDLSDQIEDAAGTPKSAVGPDGQSATARDIKDLIEADRFLNEKAAARNGGIGIRFFNTRPPGAV